MSLKLYSHPFSSYCQKVLIALYENDTAFDVCMLDNPGAMEEVAARWPLRRFPVLADGDRTVVEASIIIEYLGLHHPGPVPMIPRDAAVALEVRFMDRFFDLYVQTPMQKLVSDSMRAEGKYDVQGVAEAKAALETAYGWLDGVMAHRQWGAGDSFSMADCAAAPALFYADWALPIDAKYSHLKDYRGRLLARPSMARAVDDARPFRHFFPLGAPDRD